MNQVFSVSAQCSMLRVIAGNNDTLVGALFSQLVFWKFAAVFRVMAVDAGVIGGMIGPRSGCARRRRSGYHSGFEKIRRIEKAQTVLDHERLRRSSMVTGYIS